jgi:hypothetical protein
MALLQISLNLKPEELHSSYSNHIDNTQITLLVSDLGDNVDYSAAADTNI